MRRLMVIATLAAGLAGGAARAGVYGPGDPLLRYPPRGSTYSEIRSFLDPLLLARAYPVVDQPAERVKQLAADLESKPANEQKPLDKVTLAAYYFRLGRQDDAARLLGQADATGFLLRLVSEKDDLEARAAAFLSTDDSIRLGACYIRLGRPNDAIRVLSAADQTNALVLANLAAAYQDEKVREWERAAAYDDQALSVWPTERAGWTDAQLNWYHRAEVYNLKLLRLRAREAAANPPNKPWDTMDALFDKPRVPAGDDYGPVVCPLKMWGDLPSDAYPIVLQLLLWSPYDARLYWQLGELMNSLGDVADASSILNELADARRVSARELMRHRAVLNEAAGAVAALSTTYRRADNQPDSLKFIKDFHPVMWAFAPRGLLLAGAGDLANESAMAAESQNISMQEQAQQQQQPGGAPPPPPPAGWWPDWRTMFIGFAAGLIVATLGALQWTEWRRRRQAAAAPPAPAEGPSPQRTEPAVHDAGTFQADAPARPDRVEGAP